MDGGGVGGRGWGMVDERLLFFEVEKCKSVIGAPPADLSAKVKLGQTARAEQEQD